MKISYIIPPLFALLVAFNVIYWGEKLIVNPIKVGSCIANRKEPLKGFLLIKKIQDEALLLGYDRTGAAGFIFYEARIVSVKDYKRLDCPRNLREFRLHPGAAGNLLEMDLMTEYRTVVSSIR